jgi:hypothetical protein
MVVATALMAFDLVAMGHRFDTSGALVGQDKTIKRDKVDVYLVDCSKLASVYVYDRAEKVVAQKKVTP